MLLQVTILASWLAAQSSTAAAPFSADELRHIDAAVVRGRSWLLEHQSPSGAFAPLARDAVCPVALTSMALWALASTGSEPLNPMRNAARFLLAHKRPDGGVYDPRHGLSVYTSGVALQALRTLTSGHEFPEAEGVLPGLDLFVYRASAPESLADAESDPRKDQAGPAEAQRLLQDRTRYSPEEQRALEFLAGSARPHSNAPPLRVRIPGWSGRRADLSPFSYEDVLPFVYLPLEADQQVALRAYEALRQYYDLERNPDLTKRYGELGFPGTQGLYYYYFLVARALSVRGLPWIDLSSGARRDWVRELSMKLLSLQRAEGAWRNADGHWWEQEPVLVTSYALLALQLCRNVGAR